MSDVLEVFRPTTCPNCAGSMQYDDNTRVAQCTGCWALWVTDKKPEYPQPTLSYLIHEGKGPSE